MHVQPDNYVAFESVKKGGEYVAIQKNGIPPEKVKDLGATDEQVHFFVRVQVMGSYNTVLPSVFQTLWDQVLGQVIECDILP